MAKYSYILIRVEEEENSKVTKVGFLRKIIHQAAMKFNITVADNIIHPDRKIFPGEKPVPYAEAEDLFKKIMP